MGLYLTTCPSCARQFLWFSGNPDQRCEGCKTMTEPNEAEVRDALAKARPRDWSGVWHYNACVVLLNALDTARQETAAVRGELARVEAERDLVNDERRLVQRELDGMREQHGKPCEDRYLSAVRGRQEFRAALREARGTIASLNQQIANYQAVEAERLRITGELMAERDAGLRDATYLFRLLAPQCEPLDTLSGVLTQINNWCAGATAERDAATAEAATLRLAIEHVIERHQSARPLAWVGALKIALATPSPGTALLAEHAARMEVLETAIGRALRDLGSIHIRCVEGSVVRDIAEQAHAALATVVGPALGRKG